MPAHRSPLPLILASGSPRRKELLRAIGLKFEVLPADVDETPRAGESPERLVGRLSSLKAAAVAERRSDALVIAADTVVAIDDEVLGKPRDSRENRRFLERLSGRTHDVYTGHCLRRGGASAHAVRHTRVTFRELSVREIESYLATEEGLDKAGGYAVQGLGATLVPHIEGCYFNVVGLSLATVVELAEQLGVELV